MSTCSNISQINHKNTKQSYVTYVCIKIDNYQDAHRGAGRAFDDVGAQRTLGSVQDEMVGPRRRGCALTSGVGGHAPDAVTARWTPAAAEVSQTHQTVGVVGASSVARERLQELSRQLLKHDR